MKKTVRWNRKYPWERWFARRSFRVAKGVDYECRTYAMANSIRNNASQRGLKVSLRVIGEEAIVVQVTSRGTA